MRQGDGMNTKTNTKPTAADNDDTEVEARRGFSIVWNANGAWRVEVKRGRVTRLA